MTNQNNTCIALTTIFLLVSAWCTPTLHADLREGLVGHYRFDEGQGSTTADSSSSGRTGKLNGSAAWVPGVYGNALQFNGTDAYVGTGESFLNDLSEFTLAGWVSAANPTAVRIGLFGQDNTLECGFNWGELGIYSLSNATGDWQWIGAAYRFPYPAWHHVAVTGDTERIVLYVDGEVAASGNVGTSTFGRSGAPFNIGAAVLDDRDGWLEGEIDDVLVYTRALTRKEILNVMAGRLNPAMAAKPVPGDAVSDVPRDLVLNWMSGDFAQKHNLYFGTQWQDVNDASVDAPLSALVAPGLDVNSFDPGRLAFDRTYYWRVDEVNGVPDHAVSKGNVWRFTVEPYARPITDVTATASSSHAEGMGPERTVDGSGLDDLDQHAVDGETMWLSGMGDAVPWIQFEFDRVYKLASMLVWNSNQTIESILGLGAKEVVIETSVDGVAWANTAGATQLSQATGTADYRANTEVDFGGAQARYVRITIHSGYGMMPQRGLSEIRFLYVPTFASFPLPADGSTTDGAAVELSWRAGREAASHRVYLGTDAADLPLVATTTEAAYLADGLTYGTSYYWSVTEVNEAEAVQTYAGDVWSFSVPDAGIVDNFELYDNRCNRIFFTWQDGFGHKGGEDIEGCDVAPFRGNDTSSTVGHASAPFAEQDIVFTGRQSMPFRYEDNSEATVNVPDLRIGQDWTQGAPTTLVLRIRGDLGNTATDHLYMKINDSKVTYDGDLSLPIWKQWSIDLGALGIDLSSVHTLCIGVEASDTGVLYVDDIALYRVPPPIVETSAGSDMSLVAHWKLDETEGLTAIDSGAYGNHGTLVGMSGTEWTAGILGGALEFAGTAANPQYVDVGNPSSLRLYDSATISAWVKMNPNNGGAYMGVGGKLKSKSDWYKGFALVRHRSNVFRLWCDDGAYGLVDATSDTIYTDTEWHHLVGVIDAGRSSLYVDGVKQAQEGNVDLTDSGGHAYIGKQYAVPDEHRCWKGVIDEVRIYCRALSAEEIAGL